jgi:protein-disulfide isomerase
MMSINVEVFASPSCSRCGRTVELIQELANELGTELIVWRKVNVVDEIDYAVSLGVLSTPAIAINGKLVFTGQPTLKKLRSELLRQLKDKPTKVQDMHDV